MQVDVRGSIFGGLNRDPAMQVDVVEAQSAAMFERLGKASDFGDAESAHTAFIAALLEQTMLTSPRVADSLTTIYALCTCLCSLAQVHCCLPLYTASQLDIESSETGNRSDARSSDIPQWQFKDAF